MLSQAARNLRTTIDDPKKAEALMRELLERAGITLGGTAPHDIVVHDDRFYNRVFRDGSLGMGESYMAGWWDAESLDDCLTKIVSAGLREEVMGNWKMVAHVVKSKLLNMQSLTRSFEVGQRHYDIGNDLYEAMLDSRMVYTCGYWKDATDLDAAQEAKLDLVCRKVGLEPGMKVLELGCGWGSFAQFAAEKYGVHITGYTVSKEQVELGKKRCAGLPVDLRLADYREASGQYDAVISIGIMEHVGYKNYRTYMELASRCLAPNGVAFVHTIGGNRSRTLIDPWFHKYIFPNALLPSIAQLSQALEGVMVLEDVHNFGPYYDTTLMAWYDNFEAAWPELSKNNPAYTEEFRRMWHYYLMSSAAGFRSRDTQLYQLVMTNPGTPQPTNRRAS